ncbi:MAG TPA: polyprenyl synthetase family protein [Chitinophagales bacterium]|mgnify:CR=1 FL=1|nr:polyprenyl synthetase family protein [Chitinophagales bacterium]
MADLKSIQQPIASELAQFEDIFRKSLKSDVRLLDQVMYYIVKRKGKQMRPMFVMLSAKVCGNFSQSTFTAATLIELLHTATLVHDDVVDDAYERRGFFSINALWKNKIAVLIGDYLLAKGLLVSLDNNEFRMLKITSDAVREMSEGELLQIEKARKLDIKEDIYFEIIRKKTATLIASACSAGAASATTDEALIAAMRLFGEKIGIAFQIKDDLLDYGDDDIGKPTGIDIQERKLTLPIIYSLQQAERADRRKIINIIKHHNTDKERVQWVIDYVRANGGIAYAEKYMHQYQQEAFELLEQFPDSPSRKALKDLVLFTTERKK